MILLLLMFFGVFLMAGFLTPGDLFADVIYLKNGRTIWADQVRQTDTHVEYDVGENTFAVPKSSVDHVVAGGMPPEYGSSSTSAAPRDIPALSPTDNLSNSVQFTDKIIHDGKVDADALAALEQGDPHAAAAGYFIAGKYEFDHGDFSKARTHFDAALRFDGENPTILNYYAALLIKTGEPEQALNYAEHAVRIAPTSPDALDMLGYAQYSANRTQNAIETFKRSLQLRPDPAIQQILTKAEKDATAESSFSEHDSSHFSLHYEGKQTSENFRRQLISVLESDYDDLVRQLGVEPRSTITVTLYTDQAFFDVTQAPSWTGALNDGKLRIPINGLDSITPNLARVLKHELTHSFINYLAAGRCPHWLNEGVAQAMEPKSLSYGPQLAKLFAAQQEMPFNTMEGSFMGFSGPQATLAYEESLAATDYIIDTYGSSDLQRILQRIGEGNSTEAAMRATIHLDYGELETEVGKYLAGKYGS
jgi:predicted TPR repeat methyltransferase